MRLNVADGKKKSSHLDIAFDGELDVLIFIEICVDARWVVPRQYKRRRAFVLCARFIEPAAQATHVCRNLKMYYCV